MNKTFITVLVLLLVIGGAYLVVGKNSKVEAPGTENESMEKMEDEGANMEGDMMGSPDMSMEGTTHEDSMADLTNTQAEVKEIVVEGTNFYFSPNTIKVKKGDKVKITFKNTGGFHDFVIDEFNVATSKSNGPNEESVEFVASQTGNFEFYCSVGSHRAMGMKGTLIIEE